MSASDGSDVEMIEDQSEDGEIEKSPSPKHKLLVPKTPPLEPEKEQDVDEISLSSYEGETADSLDIKPPQAAIHRKERTHKRDKRERGERHSHKESHRKDRHRLREHRDRRGERHRGERRHHRDRERRVDRGERRDMMVGERQERLPLRRLRERDKDKERMVVEDLRERLERNERERMERRAAEEQQKRIEKIEKMKEREREIEIRKEKERKVMEETPKERAERFEREKRKERLLLAEREMERQKEIVAHKREIEAKRVEIEAKRVEIEAKRIRRDLERQREQAIKEIERRRERSRSRERKRRREDEKNRKRIKSESDREEGETRADEDEEPEAVGEKFIEPSSPHQSGGEETDKGTESDSGSSSTSSTSSEADSDTAGSSPEDLQDHRSEEDEELEEEEEEKSPIQREHLGPSDEESERGKHSEGGDENYVDDSPPQSPVELKKDLPPYLPAIQGCRSVEEFQCLNRIEEGTYGVVYRARDKRTEEIVALKRLKMEKEKEGFPITSLREINTLLKAQHPNIVTVREIVVGSNMDKIFIVMDYVEHDLKSLMETMKQKKQVFIPGEVKCLLVQLLRAVAHLHDNWILHRDLKTSNLLLSHKGILKVGDFGLAREYGSPLKAYTPIVVTLWYRAPELLLGTKEYSTYIDMWSVGCIFGELLTMEAMFPGKSEVDQLNRIFKALGTPNEKVWPGYSKLPAIQKMTFAEFPVSQLRSRIGVTMLSETGLDLMNKFLTYDPHKRITAEEAARHKYFQEAPQPIDPAMFPTWPAKSELGHRKAVASPKPPSGGREYKQLGDADEDLAVAGGFHMGDIHKKLGIPPVDTEDVAAAVSHGFHMGDPHKKAAAVGAGFSLKF